MTLKQVILTPPPSRSSSPGPKSPTLFSLPPSPRARTSSSTPSFPKISDKQPAIQIQLQTPTLNLDALVTFSGPSSLDLPLLLRTSDNLFSFLSREQTQPVLQTADKPAYHNHHHHHHRQLTKPHKNSRIPRPVRGKNIRNVNPQPTPIDPPHQDEKMPAEAPEESKKEDIPRLVGEETNEDVHGLFTSPAGIITSPKTNLYYSAARLAAIRNDRAQVQVRQGSENASWRFPDVSGETVSRGACEDSRRIMKQQKEMIKKELHSSLEKRREEAREALERFSSVKN
ncbi:hypothetical protein QBC43DRAFT_123058 [Cladorrhinum sp. PSN259]|nr:hypothetical protein QBC43DRAFT_123058 [Cladorrhinum sp. PSN259]